ncbi:MAG: mechanosensitive ion channel [Deltaproteobacteria bacterium]|nr:mechanosensitive ion channel [Deltaproteobacteria bacterium]
MQAENPTFKHSLDIVWQSILDLWTGLLESVPLLLAGVIIFLLTWTIARIVDRVLSRALRDSWFKRGFKDLLLQMATVLVWVAGLTVTAVIVFPGLTPAKVLAALGIGSIALGFAFKDIVENFLAGILILWRFPFDPGDFIRWGDIEGKVEEITIRMTLIRKSDGVLVVLPNATLFKEPVDVLTDQDSRRVTVICGIAYGENVDEARGVIEKAVESCDTRASEKPVQIFAQEFADSSINFEVTWWCGSTPVEVRRSRDQVVAAVKRALDEEGIEIPFPYRTLTLKEPLHINNSRLTSETRQQERNAGEYQST